MIKCLDSIQACLALVPRKHPQLNPKHSLGFKSRGLTLCEKALTMLEVLETYSISVV